MPSLCPNSEVSKPYLDLMFCSAFNAGLASCPPECAVDIVRRDHPRHVPCPLRVHHRSVGTAHFLAEGPLGRYTLPLPVSKTHWGVLLEVYDVEETGSVVVEEVTYRSLNGSTPLHQTCARRLHPRCMVQLFLMEDAADDDACFVDIKISSVQALVRFEYTVLQRLE